MNTIRIALIGYGNVGQAFARMLRRRDEYIRETFDTEAAITAICTRRLGGVTDPAGIDTEHLTDDRFDRSLDALTIIRGGEYDVMVELTPINIKTGQPATDHVRTALSLKKHVITANKGPVAWAYRELRDLAREQGVCFCHEATVMDGVPVYNLAKETLMGCRITEIQGILNATTNFILTKMEQGMSFDDAVAEGRRQGFVEADPSMDIDGWDAAAKLTALMNVLMDVHITPMDIDRTGISEITKADLDEAAARGKRIKLLCHGRMEDSRPVGTVRPTLVDADHIAAIMDTTASYVTVTTDLMGGVTVIEEPFEPEIDHTAYGVLSDLLRILTEIRTPSPRR
ncbi:MAG: homoserine dehydrogenase [Firmicutes bacterium]|nr:homoserine dehydrogenase [Bacillota bacterium]